MAGKGVKKISPIKIEGQASRKFNDFGLKVSIVKTSKNILGHLSMTSVSLKSGLRSSLFLTLDISVTISFLSFWHAFPQDDEKKYLVSCRLSFRDIIYLPCISESLRSEFFYFGNKEGGNLAWI